MSRFRIQSLQAVSDALSVKRLDQHITVLLRALYAAYRFQQELSINHGTEKKARKEKKIEKTKEKDGEYKHDARRTGIKLLLLQHHLLLAISYIKGYHHPDLCFQYYNCKYK